MLYNQPLSLRSLPFLLCIPNALASTSIGPTPAPHIRRQNQPSEPEATTSIDWWPYPTWGADTPSTASAGGSSVTPSVFFAPRASDSSEVLPEATLSPISSISTTNFAASASTPSFIHITALPAATTPGPKHRRLRHITPFNTAYLAPIFAVIGVALGAICGWVLVRCRRYRQRRRDRSDSLEPGPEYTPPPGLESETTSMSNGGTVAPHSHTSSFLAGKPANRGRSSSSIPSREGSQKDGWIQRVLSTRRSQTMPSPNNQLQRANDRLSVFAEVDPFLSPRASRAPSSLGSGPPTPCEPVSPARALLAPSPRSPNSAISDDDWEHVPYESLRHKSIRRGILERLKHGQRYRGGHKRADSDMTVDEVRPPSHDDYSPVPVAYDPPQRGRSLVRSGSTGSGLGVEKTVSGPGFRIIEEDTEAQDRAGSSWKWSLPWSTSSKRLTVEDKFTSLPSRRSLSEKRSPGASPSHSRTPSSIGAKAEEKVYETPPRVDISVLPASPPLLTSPPLQAQLFFGSIPQAVPTLDIDNKNGSASTEYSDRRQPDTYTKAPKKLHTARDSSPLPFPSSDHSSSSRKKLTKPPSRSTLPARSGKSSMDDKPPGPRTSTDRCGALVKVDEILARSWSQREVRGEEPLGSPTMFGALPVSSSGEWGGDVLGGIEERLAQLQGKE